MDIEADRGRDTGPLWRKFLFLCALHVGVAALVAAGLERSIPWLLAAAFPLELGALATSALIFRDALRQKQSLQKLHRQLELLRQHRLPEIVKEAVASRNAGQPLLRMPTMLDDKLGGLVADVEKVCADAIRLAQDHDELRAGYAEVFVNMFRRTQTLLLRQLQIIEGLEHDNRSASDLNRFYQLDHLVMRMRRNNENILVLSGTELVRKTKEAVPVDDLLRASISEIDSYQRVRLLTAPSVRVSNTAAGDLIRIVAELLDNATSFSPPDKPVTVKAELGRHHGISIGVIDNGIGMSDKDIRETNEQLRRLGSAEIARSRRLGLLVVGRLAGRHGFRVELFGGDDVEGVSALVSVPSSVLVNEDTIRAMLPGDAGRNSVERYGRRVTAGRRPVAEVSQERAGELAGRGDSAIQVTTTLRRHDTAVPEGGPARRPSPWHRRSKVHAIRRQSTGLTASELMAQAHSDVPGELPTRIPNRSEVREEQPGSRKASRWFEARSKIRQRESSVSGLSDGRVGSTRKTQSPMDVAWEKAEKSRMRQDYTYTEDGLPLRMKGAHLFAGDSDSSAEPAQAPKPIERDAKHTQRRLSSYQQGVQKAKEQEARLRGTRHAGGWTVLEIDQK